MCPVRRGKENKQKIWKTSLATDENQDVYSYDRLFSKPTLFTASLPNLIHGGSYSDFPDKTADCIFYKGREGDEYQFQINF